MEMDVLATARAPPELPETSNARSIYMNIFTRQRASLSGWKHRIGEVLRDISQKRFRGKIIRCAESTSAPETVENLCAFCAELHVENFFQPHGVTDSVVEVDRILNILSRSDACLLCSLISATVMRRGNLDPNHRILLGCKGMVFSIFVKENSGDKEEIGSFSERAPWIPGSWRSLPQPYLTYESSVSEIIHWPVVRKWIEDSPKKEKLDHHPTDFRLIDVEDLCVVRAQAPCEYVCLSYVWGKDATYQATLDTIHDLERPNSLGTWNDLERRSNIERSDVPATIKDAIIACYSLGKRYLWVDRLCIVQDEDEEKNPSKKEQINAMGNIYRYAFVTIVALEGADAAHGLDGVSLGRVPHLLVRIGRKAFSEATERLDGALKRSTWNKRGWTYQEAVLSPRLLFFTKRGLWYEDNNMGWVKFDVQDWALGFKSEQERLQFQWNSRHDALGYTSAVKMITDREFSYDWDILNGFSGVLNCLFGKDHRFALPLEDFDYAFLWNPGREHTKREAQGGSAFPSWSWVSIKGAIWYNEKSQLIPVSSWVFLDDNEAGQVPWPRERDGISLLEVAVSSILWRHGCMVESFPTNLYFKGKFGEYAKMFRKNWPTRRDFFNECRGIRQNSQEKLIMLGRFDDAQIAVGSKHGTVLSYLQAAVLTMALRGEEIALCYEGRQIGVVYFDFPSDCSKALEMLQRAPMEVDVFALSASWYPNYMDGCNEDDDIDLQSGILNAEPSGSTNSIIGALELIWMKVMVTRTSNGVFYRTGLGDVQLMDWLKVERKFKAIVLQ